METSLLTVFGANSKLSSITLFSGLLNAPLHPAPQIRRVSRRHCALYKFTYLLTYLFDESHWCAIFRDEDQQSRRPSRPALSFASDNQSKKSNAAASRSSMSSIFGKRGSLAPSAAAEKLGPVRGRDIQVSALY